MALVYLRVSVGLRRSCIEDFYKLRYRRQEKDACTARDTRKEERRILAGLAAFVTVAAAATYVLGLIVVGGPLYRKTRSASVALFAVAIISKTVIAARGVSELVGWPLVGADILAFWGSLTLVIMNITLWAAENIWPLKSWSLPEQPLTYLSFLMALALGYPIGQRVSRAMRSSPLLGNHTMRQRRTESGDNQEASQMSMRELLWSALLTVFTVLVTGYALRLYPKTAKLSKTWAQAN